MYEPDYPNIKYFEDGNAYEICGKSVLVIGGAYSVDKWYRLNRAGVTNKLDKDYLNPRKTGWFPDEQLLNWEMTTIEKEHFGKLRYDIKKNQGVHQLAHPSIFIMVLENYFTITFLPFTM
jgi:hypothetical protein